MKNNKVRTDKILSGLGIESLNRMQNDTLQQFHRKEGFILLSPTGSGKTLAFLLPLVELLDPEKTGVQALILAPSRELALQIETVLRQMQIGLKVSCFYGGHAMQTEIQSLEVPPSVLIGTPGRILDHLDRETLNLAETDTLILDEYDKSLELGFYDQMAAIADRLENMNRVILTSATELDKVPGFVRMEQMNRLDYLNTGIVSRREVKIVRSEEKDKLVSLKQLLCHIGNESTLVFLNHRAAVERVSEFLDEEKIDHGFFHGGLDQTVRERTLTKFRNGTNRILISTDLAARGLDIPDIGFVIHYQMSPKEEDFVHRNGRTARQQAKGMVYLLLGPDEKQPEYIPDKLRVESIDLAKAKPSRTPWATLFIGKGKKDKVNKGDIVGFLCKTGKLKPEEVGMIEVKDRFSYVAIPRSKMKDLIKKVRNEKLKKQKAKIEEAL